MKKLLLLSLLVLFSCSKDSEGEESNASQTLIESINGKLFAYDSTATFPAAFWIDITKQHPLTKIDIQWRGGQIEDTQCYQNYYTEHIYGPGGTTNEFNVLINDNGTYKAELLYSTTALQNLCGLGTHKMTVTLSSSGIKTLILKEVRDYIWENPNNDAACNSGVNENSDILYLVEDFPITPSELCSLSD